MNELENLNIENLSIEELNATKWKCGDHVFQLVTRIAKDAEGHYVEVIFNDTTDDTRSFLESFRWGDAATESFARKTVTMAVGSQIQFKVFPEMKDQYLTVDNGDGLKYVVNPHAPLIDMWDAKYQVTRVTE